MQTARNVGIVVVLAAIVAFAPGGRGGATLLGQLLSAVFLCAVVVILARLYRQFRTDIFGLGDRGRAVLYVSFAVLLLTLAGSARLFAAGGAGTAAWFVLMGGASYGLYASYRQFRALA
ncbi:MAG: hypothetical protein M3P39_04045 [Actinomycetota bacterium]|nr:hypothetical protein [Actinomycetota bacterium]